MRSAACNYPLVHLKGPKKLYGQKLLGPAYSMTLYRPVNYSFVPYYGQILTAFLPLNWEKNNLRPFCPCIMHKMFYGIGLGIGNDCNEISPMPNNDSQRNILIQGVELYRPTCNWCFKLFLEEIWKI